MRCLKKIKAIRRDTSHIFFSKKKIILSNDEVSFKLKSDFIKLENKN